MIFRVLAFCIAATCAFAATEHPAAVAGIYEANLRVPGTAGKKITLNLAQDGTASMRTELVGQSEATDKGTWSAAKDEVRVDLEGKPPFVWRLRKGRLSPKEWDRAQYGKAGLTLRRPR